MASLSNSLALLLVLIFLTSLIILPCVFVKAEYSDESNFINHELVLVSPTSNIAYSDIMSLNFTVDWSVSGPIIWMHVQFSYAIDDSAKISASGSSYIQFTGSPSTETNALVDISNLTSGLHKLTIFADGNYDIQNDFVKPYNYSFSPVYFSVNVLSATPTAPPTLTPSSTATPSDIKIEPFAVATVATVSAASVVIVVAGLLVYYKKHKGSLVAV